MQKLTDIKTKKVVKGTIKTLNKTVVGTEKIKANIVSTKEKANKITSKNDENEIDYTLDKTYNFTKNAPYRVKRMNKYGNRAINQTSENIKNVSSKIKKKIYQKKIKKTQKSIKGVSKKTKRTIKSIKRTGQATYKSTKTTLKTTAKTSKKAYQIAKSTAKITVKTVKSTIKATVTTIKAIIATTKAIIAAILAGGWIAVIIITVICLIGLLCSSIFGIFFSSEDTGSYIVVNGEKQSITMNKVVSDLNIEFMNKITQIQKENSYDEYDIIGKRAEWKDILAVYATKISTGENQADVITLDENKISILKEIFWEMNEVTYTTETIEENNGEETISIRKLHIQINSKTSDEIAEKYNFNKEQKEQLKELAKSDYAKMWSNVIYGTKGNSDIVKVAQSYLGNIGGEIFWSWYGFESRVSWCACFVSFCANECGYIESGIIPKFAGCEAEGVAWFKTCGLWKDRGYIPKEGDIIFFDWEQDGHSDHVGVVEKIENGRVYTIEGNSNDSCKENNYDLNSTDIKGYGTPMY